MMLPDISIMITTHNRTNCAINCIQTFIDHISYDGKIYWFIADDQSDESHKIRLLDLFVRNNLSVCMVETNSARHGHPASINNGLKQAFQYSDFVLRMEDDWVLRRELPLTKFVTTMVEDPNVCAIRLGCLAKGIMRETYEDDFYKVLVGRHKMFNMQIMLCRKNIYDFLGFYPEDLPGGRSEDALQVAYREKVSTTSIKDKYKILVPAEFIPGPPNDNPSLYFEHIGISVSGHTQYGCPPQYLYFYDNLFFIITAVKNSSKTIDKCAESILSQTYRKFRWIVVDDNSTDDSWEKLQKLASSDDRIVLKKNIGSGMGAAWNTGLIGCSLSSYVLFLDSDDYYMSDTFLSELNAMLIDSNNTTDCILLSYFNELRKKNLIFKSDDLEYSIDHHSSAPWSKCIKSSIYMDDKCHFPVGKRCCNDTIQDLFLFTKIKSVASFSKPVVYYSKLSPHSIWNNLTRNNKIPEDKTSAIYAVLQTINELDSLHFENELLDSIRVRRKISLMNYLPPNFADVIGKKVVEDAPSVIAGEQIIDTEKPKANEINLTDFDFQFGLNNVKHDVVFILGDGSKNCDAELFFAFSSLMKFCRSWVRNVYIVGSKPRCSLDRFIYTHIPCDDICSNKDANIIYKIKYAIENIPDLSDNFLKCSDDQLVTKPCTWDDFWPMSIRQFSKSDSDFYQLCNRRSNNAWLKNLYNTLYRFKDSGHPVYYYQPHVWAPINKQSFLNMCSDIDYLNERSIILFSLYYNYINFSRPKPCKSHVFYAQPMIDWAKEFRMHNYRYIGYTDDAFTEKFRSELVKIVKFNGSYYDDTNQK